jgi:trk system potassium uptake protein TrkA
LVCIVERGGEVIIPDGDFILQAKDVISVVVPASQLMSFFRNIDYKKTRISDVIVVGGGTTTVYLGKMLDVMGINITIIEKNRARCEELCELLPNACIVCGDGTDKDLLAEEGIEKTGAFVAWTDFDEENIMLSMYAKSICDAKIISQVHRTNYDELITTLDVGSILYPKNITAEYVVRYVRAMSNTIGSNVETLYHLIEGKVEALEFVVREDVDGLVDVPLADLKLKENIIICGIQHQGRTFTPKGHDVIKKGDSVIIITTTFGLTKLRDILA